MVKLAEAATIAELVKALKEEGGDSYASLSAKSGINASTLHRMAHGKQVGDTTLDRLADYAHMTREYVYSLAKGLREPRRRSTSVALVAAILEEFPAEVQELFLVQARAYADLRKKIKKDSHEFVARD